MSGIIPPLVTPLKDNDTLDVEGLERLIEHLIAGGVHGLFILGTTGEEQSLSYHLRHEMIRETCRINNGRLPVLVSAWLRSLRTAVRRVSCRLLLIILRRGSPNWLSSMKTLSRSCLFPCSSIICLRM